MASLPERSTSKVRKQSLEDEQQVKGRPADNLEPELEDAKQELAEIETTPEDIVVLRPPSHQLPYSFLMNGSAVNSSRKPLEPSIRKWTRRRT